MDNAVFQLLDVAAAEATADVEMAVAAVQGIHARVYRDDPSQRGLQRFLVETQTFPATAARVAAVRLSRFDLDSREFRTAIEPQNVDSPGTLPIAQQQLHALVEQLRLSEARRFRAALVARSSVAGAYSHPRVLNRAGQARSASDAIYLIVRKAALDSFNEGQVAGLRAEGAETAQVHHFNTDHSTNGEQFSLDSYSDIQERLFHPRSSAVVERIS